MPPRSKYVDLVGNNLNHSEVASLTAATNPLSADDLRYILRDYLNRKLTDFMFVSIRPVEKQPVVYFIRDGNESEKQPEFRASDYTFESPSNVSNKRTQTFMVELGIGEEKNRLIIDLEFTPVLIVDKQVSTRPSPEDLKGHLLKLALS